MKLDLFVSFSPQFYPFPSLINFSTLCFADFPGMWRAQFADFLIVSNLITFSELWMSLVILTQLGVRRVLLCTNMTHWFFKLSHFLLLMLYSLQSRLQQINICIMLGFFIRLDLPGETALSLSANHLQKLRLSFQLTTPFGNPFQPHQVVFCFCFASLVMSLLR